MINNLGVVNSEVSNLKSITNLLDYLDHDYHIINTKFDIRRFDGIILPGVGNFKTFTLNLKKNNIYESLLSYLLTKKNFLGICLGMQFLFEESEESFDVKGSNMLKGRVRKFNFKEKT